MYNSLYRSPYAQRLNAMEQQMMYPQAQPIQPVNNVVQPQAYCYSVTSADDMANITPMLNTTYLGINSKAKEIYVRRLNNDGLIENEIYKKSSGNQEKDSYNVIMEKLSAIEAKLSVKENQDEKRTFKTDIKPNETRASSKKPDNGSF